MQQCTYNPTSNAARKSRSRTLKNSPQIGVVITIHDQELLLAYEAQKKFSGVGTPLTYMFVGSGPADKISTIPNVIIARNLPNNIEDHKYLVDFTSWYALVRKSYCQIWCLRVLGHAAIWSVVVASIPSLNLTPVMTLAR